MPSSIIINAPGSAMAVSPGSSSTSTYTYNNTTYSVPNIGFIYKMSHFDYSIIVDVVVNDTIDDKLRKIDRMYDVKTFLESLKKYLESNNITIPLDIDAFISNCITNSDKLEPKILLDDDLFYELKNNNSINKLYVSKYLKIHKKQKQK
jgi:hypothetical protein